MNRPLQNYETGDPRTDLRIARNRAVWWLRECTRLDLLVDGMNQDNASRLRIQDATAGMLESVNQEPQLRRRPAAPRRPAKKVSHTGPAQRLRTVTLSLGTGWRAFVGFHERLLQGTIPCAVLAQRIFLVSVAVWLGIQVGCLLFRIYGGG